MEKLFNREVEFTASIISGGKLTATMRFPTDQELCDRARKLKLVRRNLGRGKSQSDAGNSIEVSAELFERIRVEGENFTPEDAAAFVAKIDKCEVIEVEREGNIFHITMEVPGATVQHSLRMPTQKELVEYGRSSIHAVDDRRSTEIRLRLEPGGELWAKLLVRFTGYKSSDHGAVPITHKDAAVSEVIAQVQRLEEEDESPEL
jgi:hypothetical protein